MLYPVDEQGRPRLMDKHDLAALLNVTVGTIEVRLSRRPHLLPPPIWIGGRAQWRPATVHEWLSRHEADPDGGRKTDGRKDGKGSRGPGRPRNPM